MSERVRTAPRVSGAVSAACCLAVIVALALALVCATALDVTRAQELPLRREGEGTTGVGPEDWRSPDAVRGARRGAVTSRLVGAFGHGALAPGHVVRSTRRMVGAPLDQDAILTHISGDAPVRFKPVGSTSVVYEMLLDGPVRAAFKPNSRHRPRGAQSEIAAYRVARLLGMDNVPPAITRRLTSEDIQAQLHPDFVDAWDEIVAWTVFEPDGACVGAAIYWVPEMRSLGVDRDSRLGRFSRHLRQSGDVPPQEMGTHTDFATMVAFDYLIGNWDRWSGGNAQGLPDGTRLFVRDHDSAFASPLSPPLHRRVLDHLLRTEKLPRSFVDRLLAMTESRLRAELARDPGARAGALALNDRQIADVMDRRRALLSYVVALVDAYGEERVFSLL